MNEYLEREYRLKFSDFNCHDDIAPYAVLDFFQDVAGEHANYIGVGFDDMLKRGYYWVLVRTKFDIISSPKEYGYIKVKTWPHERGKVDFDRDYLILDKDNNVLIKGVSKWVVIDAKTRRVTPCKDLAYACGLVEDKNYEGPFRKIEDFDINGFNKVEGKASYIDLDHNGHVNNIAYARFISNAIEFKEDEKIKSFEIDYNKELKSGEDYILYYKNEDGVIKVKGYIKETNEVSFVAMINLEKK